DLQQLRQIYAGWLPLIPLLQEDQLTPLLVWLRQEALLGDPEQALRLARILERRLQSPILLTEVQQHILRLLRELAPQEARDYAESWVAAKPWYQGRLLGYWVLAEWELQNGHVERALWVALEAIV